MKTYYLSEFFRADWVGAYNFCRANGLQLAIIDSTDEATKFLGFLNNYISASTVYIGAMSATIGDKSNWLWFKTGQKVSYSFTWNSKEPNGQTTENCIGLVAKKKSFLYSDLACSGYLNSFLNFVCQEETSKGKGLNEVVAST